MNAATRRHKGSGDRVARERIRFRTALFFTSYFRRGNMQFLCRRLSFGQILRKTALRPQRKVFKELLGLSIAGLEPTVTMSLQG